MQVFLTGATGVLGRAVLPHLLGAGHQVRALVRSEAQADAVRAAGAEPITGDLFDDAVLAGGMARADAVLHLATRIPPATRMRSRAAWKENDRLRGEGTRRIASAARAAGVGTLVYPSVTFVYEDGGEDWTDAETGRTGSPWTVASSLLAEDVVRQFATEGRRGVVLRLGVLYGPGNPLVRDLLASARRGLSGVVGRADGYQSSIWADDAATALVAALAAPSGTYDVVDDEPMRRGDIDQVLAGIVGRRSLRRLPEVVQRPLIGDGAPFLFASQRVSNRRFRDATGWSPSVPSLRIGLPRAAGDDAGAAPTDNADSTPSGGRGPAPTLPLVTLALGFLAVLTLTIGAWQLFAPASFFFDFPGGGFAWVHTDGPYNEHLVRDLGGPPLALGVLATWVLLAPSPRLVRAVGLMAVLPSVPHFVYHLATLGLLPTLLDRVLQTSTLGLGLIAGIVLLVAPVGSGAVPNTRSAPA